MLEEIPRSGADSLPLIKPLSSVVDTGGKFAAGVNDNNGYKIRLLRL
jgi:hypothetical protein